MLCLPLVHDKSSSELQRILRSAIGQTARARALRSPIRGIESSLRSPDLPAAQVHRLGVLTRAVLKSIRTIETSKADLAVVEQRCY